jgi:hypothetical protein
MMLLHRVMTSHKLIQHATVATQVGRSNLAKAFSKRICFWLIAAVEPHYYLGARMMTTVVPIHVHSAMIKGMDRFVKHGLCNLLFRLQIVFAQYNLSLSPSVKVEK